MVIRSRNDSAPTTQRHIPALRFRALTPAYDLVVRITTRERAFRRELLDVSDLGAARRVLDVGCGTGTWAIAAKQANPDLEVIGIDADAEILARARAKSDSQGGSISFVTGSATDLPFPDRSFDRVTSSLVFHHLTAAQKRRASHEINRILTADGAFHLADWVQPANMLTRTSFRAVQLLDGRETTQDHADGRLLEILRAGGLVGVRQHHTLNTPVGTIGLVSARSSGLS